MNRGLLSLRTAPYVVLVLGLMTTLSCKSEAPTPLPPPISQPAPPAAESNAPLLVPEPPELLVPRRIPDLPLPPPPLEMLFSSSRDGNWQIYATSLDGANVKRLTNDSADDLYPVYSPGGSKIAFASNRTGDWDIYVMNADGTGITNITNNPAPDTQPTWSPDGKRIAFASDRSGKSEIWVMDADGKNPAQFTVSLYGDASPRWSPTSNYIAFVGFLPTGARCLFVENIDAPGRYMVAVLANVDTNPLTNATAWSPDGNRLGFIDFFWAGRLEGLYITEVFSGSKTIAWQSPASPMVGPVDDSRYVPTITGLAWSLDSRRIAFGGAKVGIGTVDIYDGTMTQIASTAAANDSPGYVPKPFAVPSPAPSSPSD